jgi:hypothetical protein
VDEGLFAGKCDEVVGREAPQGHAVGPSRVATRSGAGRPWINLARLDDKHRKTMR